MPSLSQGALDPTYHLVSVLTRYTTAPRSHPGRILSRAGVVPLGARGRPRSPQDKGGGRRSGEEAGAGREMEGGIVKTGTGTGTGAGEGGVGRAHAGGVGGAAGGRDVETAEVGGTEEEEGEKGFVDLEGRKAGREKGFRGGEASRTFFVTATDEGTGDERT